MSVAEDAAIDVPPVTKSSLEIPPIMKRPPFVVVAFVFAVRKRKSSMTYGVLELMERLAAVPPVPLAVMFVCIVIDVSLPTAFT